MASKKELRKAMNARLHGLTAEEKAAASAAVCARLAAPAPPAQGDIRPL